MPGCMCVLFFFNVAFVITKLAMGYPLCRMQGSLCEKARAV